MLILLPIVWIGVNAKEGGWRYGFTFIQNNFEVALFISFAIGFLISLYHALSFDVIEGAPEKNYLKTVQNVKVKGEVGIEELSNKLKEQGQIFKSIELENGIIQGLKKVHFSPPDVITISKQGDIFEIESRPFTKLFFIDFGRNYKNVKEIAKLIKFG
ncbi:MAG: hypothetical protein ACPGTP_01170 [Bacteroidia bacterium]